MRYGILAQLGEHLPYKQRVTGSSPVVSTRIKFPYVFDIREFIFILKIILKYYKKTVSAIWQIPFFLFS